MALDFPNSPTVNQVFPSPAVAGVGQWKWDGALWQPIGLSPIIPVNVLRGYLAGLTLATAGASSQFTVAAGQCADTGATDMMTLATGLTKNTANWAVGNGGALDTGAIAPSTWYHVHVIKRPDTGVVDVAISLNAAAPTFGVSIPAAYTKSRRIGTISTNASSQWLKFVQLGDEFMWGTPITSRGGGAATLGEALQAVAAPTGIQTNIKYIALAGWVSANPLIAFYSPDISPQTVGTPVGFYQLSVSSTLTIMDQELITRTNTNAQICVNSSSTGANLWITSESYIDRRGRDV